MSAKILVVDDDPHLTRMISAALTKYGAETAIAMDGLKAKEMLTTFKPDLMILDLMMPLMNGWDLMEQLSTEGITETLPIIIISAHPRMNPEELLSQGADALMTKPFNINDLLVLVEEMVGALDNTKASGV